jgi:hypothetical protein
MTSNSLVANISYKTPTKDDLAVGFALFNYTKSKRLIVNYLYTLEKMKVANIPTFTIELVIEGQRPTIKDAFHVYGSSYLFLKENLFRILETKIPQKYTKLLFLDADIIFDNPDWYDMLSESLETHDVVHCFQTAKWLDITYTKYSQPDATTFVLAENKANTSLGQLPPEINYHSGFGYAFTRLWYNNTGFIDKSIIGAGDLIFTYGIFGLKYPIKQGMEFYDTIIKKWFETIQSARISYLPVTVYHLFHGGLVKRQYISRNKIFEDVENIEDAITTNKYGVYELIDKSYNDLLIAYFSSRDDDSID